MITEVKRASKADRIIIRNLSELYLHDFSELEDKDVNEHGLYDYDDLDLFWLDERRHAFLARTNGKIAGFALVKQGSYNERAGQDDEELVDMIDFFVLRKYRRRGVGWEMARYCFMDVPGRWQVRTDTYNPVALAFWRSAVDRFTRGAYETLSEGTGVTFYFVSGEAAS